MAQVTGVVLPNNGDRIKTENYNDPITKILAQVNGGLDSANITPGSLAWESMASFTNKIPAAAMQDSGNAEKFRTEGKVGFTASGLVWSALTGFNAAMTSGVQYSPITGIRMSIAAIASRAFTASRDTYVSISPTGAITYQEVVNNAQPPTLGVDFRWLARVITSASAITSVTDMRQLAPIATSNLSNPYKFSVYTTAGPSTGVGGTIKVPFNSKTIDPNNNFDTTNNRYYVPVTGTYQINGQVGIGPSGTGGSSESLLFVNGSMRKQSHRQVGSGSVATLPRHLISTMEQLTAGDYVELYAFCSENRDLVVGANITYFNGFLIP